TVSGRDWSSFGSPNMGLTISLLGHPVDVSWEVQLDLAIGNIRVDPHVRVSCQEIVPPAFVDLLLHSQPALVGDPQLDFRDSRQKFPGLRDQLDPRSLTVANGLGSAQLDRVGAQ